MTKSILTPNPGMLSNLKLNRSLMSNSDDILLLDVGVGNPGGRGRACDTPEEPFPLEVADEDALVKKIIKCY